MHSVVRTAKAGGAPLSKALLHASATSTTASSSHTPTALLLLQPSKAMAALSSRNSSRPVAKLASHYFPTATTAAGQTKFAMPMAHTTRSLWTRRFYNTKSYSTSTSTAGGSATVQELEQLLAKNDYKGFQEACTLATSTSKAVTVPVTKELYHFLLKTLGERPQAFASISTTAGQEGTEGGSVDPLNSAIGILTDMSREANVLGKTEVQPDRETLRLVLQVAGGGSGDWESARMLVETVRHGRLPAVLSLDQWELPDLDIPLDQVLWKSMFECIHSAAAGAGAGAEVQRQVDVMNFLMADQLARSQDVQMDEDLWGHVLQAYGKAGSAAKLNDLLPRLPAIEKTSGGSLYSNVAEALANCGLTGQAAEIMNTLSKTLDTLPSIRPFTALARQHAKRGNYEAIIADEKLWATKGQRDTTAEENRVGLLADLQRSNLEASSVALDRLVKTISRTCKDRQSNTLPDQVLIGMAAPTQLNRYQYSEATFLWARSQGAFAAIPKGDLTAKDYDQLMRISTRLNLLLPKRCSLQDHAVSLLAEMKQQGLQPLKSTYVTLMETMARTREFGASREDGSVTQRVMKVFEEMTGQAGYAAESPRDFLPLLESCFGMYSHSPFVAGQWMYSNQLYPVSMDALKTVEDMMRKCLSSNALSATTQDDNNNNKDVSVQQYHDRDTLANVLAGLAHGDQVEEIWERWDDLALQGVERDAMLYQTVIGASHGQEKMARYVLRNVRYDMLREEPAIAMTPEIFEGLMNCCVRVQDATSARSLISQCTASGEIQKTAEWYAPMVRTCLMVEGMEEEGGFLLEEMRRNEMAMDSDGSGAFLEFLMGYFVNKRGDYAAGQEVFKSYLKAEQTKVEKLVAESKAQKAKGNNKFLHNKGGIVEVSEKELVWRSEKWLRPVEHLVERVDLSPTTASMLNLLVLAQIRERAQMLELEKRSGFGAGSKDRMRDAQIVMHYLTGETKPSSSAKPTIPDASPESSPSPSLLYNSSTTASSPSTFQTSSSSSPMAADKTGRLLFINKYVLGEYIDTCIRDGSADLLEEADWALNKVMPRVIGQQRMAKDTQRLRQGLENARSRGV